MTTNNKLYIGSDEVGTGEYFGPIIVVALSFKDIDAKKFAKSIGVKDSKSLTNLQIYEISEQLRDQVEYTAKIFTPNDYRNLDKKFNLNHVKYKLHIEAHNTFNNDEKHVIDKFTTLNSMFKYAKDLNLYFNYENFILEEKAENKYLEVAAAAILAKRIWLDWMDEFLTKEGFNFNFKDKFSCIEFHKELTEGKYSIKNKIEFMKPWPINKELLEE